jgi:phospholipase/carboxylesterase
VTASAGAALDRPHVWVPGTTQAPLLLLHGTGGNEQDLLPLRDRLAPGAAALSPRGTVLDRGMPRFFRRLSEGAFDEEDLHLRVAELAGFLTAAEATYGVPPEALRGGHTIDEQRLPGIRAFMDLT